MDWEEVCQLDSVVELCSMPSPWGLSCFCIHDGVLFSAKWLHQLEDGDNLLLTISIFFWLRFAKYTGCTNPHKSRGAVELSGCL